MGAITKMKQPIYAIKDSNDEYVYFHSGYRELRTDAKVPKRSGQSEVLEVARDLIKKAISWNMGARDAEQFELDRVNDGSLDHLSDERKEYYINRHKEQLAKYTNRTFHIVKMSEEIIE